LNTLFWIARSLAPDSERGQAALEGLLTARELRSFREAIGFLWRVRILLHLVARRPEEKLTFDFQPEIARRMGWRGRGDELAVERFMRRYFQVAREVGALTRAVSAQLEARQQKKAEGRSEEHMSELQSRENLVCRLLLEKKNIRANQLTHAITQSE